MHSSETEQIPIKAIMRLTLQSSSLTLFVFSFKPCVSSSGSDASPFLGVIAASSSNSYTDSLRYNLTLKSSTQSRQFRFGLRVFTVLSKLSQLKFR